MKPYAKLPCKIIPISPVREGDIDGEIIYSAITALANFEIPHHIYDEIDAAFAEVYTNKEDYGNRINNGIVFDVATTRLKQAHIVYDAEMVSKIIDYVLYYLDMTGIIEKK
jgi:hypothetical protein